jgi:hypothetical protein
MDECFFDGAIPADVVFDMVYNPLETCLCRLAREQKKVVIPGLAMFLEQAAHQFEIWTGGSAPRAVMERAAREALGAQAAPIIKGAHVLGRHPKRIAIALLGPPSAPSGRDSRKKPHSKPLARVRCSRELDKFDSDVG